MFELNQRRYPGGKQISTRRGERIRKWFHKRSGHTFDIGLSFRAVTFADHRSGWSGVIVDIGLGWWGFSCTILAWRNGPPDKQRYISLAEQIRRDHHRTSLEEQERREAEEESDERSRTELFDKQLKEWDAKHK